VDWTNAAWVPTNRSACGLKRRGTISQGARNGRGVDKTRLAKTLLHYVPSAERCRPSILMPVSHGLWAEVVWMYVCVAASSTPTPRPPSNSIKEARKQLGCGSAVLPPSASASAYDRM